MARNDAMFAGRKRLGLDLEKVVRHEHDDKRAEQDLDSRSDQREDQMLEKSSDDFEDATEQKSSNNEQEFVYAYEYPRGRLTNFINRDDKELNTRKPAESRQGTAVQSFGTDDRLRPKYSDEAFLTTSKHKHAHLALSKVNEVSGLSFLAPDVECVLPTTSVKVVRRPLTTTYDSFELFEGNILGNGITSAETQLPN